MPQRFFTLDEAESALAELRPVAERMVELRRTMRGAVERRTAARGSIAGNGGGIARTELAELDAEVEQLAAAAAACVDRITSDGVEVKDLDRGLLDFPSRLEGREILLCWQVGEDAIEWWHGPEEGFAGRKPVDFGE